MTLYEVRKRFQERSPGIQDITGEYAVLVPLVEGIDGYSLLFEVRSAALRRQPGEVCFPGGKLESGESPTECALRETQEELGLSSKYIHIIAPLDRVLHSSGFLVHPILAWVEKEATHHLQPSPDEVESTFQVPLEFFLKEEPYCPTYALEPSVGEEFPYALIGFPKGYGWQGRNVSVPIYRWEDRAIWGITGRIVQHLSQVLRHEHD